MSELTLSSFWGAAVAGRLRKTDKGVKAWCRVHALGSLFGAMYRVDIRPVGTPTAESRAASATILTATLQNNRSAVSKSDRSNLCARWTDRRSSTARDLLSRFQFDFFVRKYRQVRTVQTDLHRRSVCTKVCSAPNGIVLILDNTLLFAHLRAPPIKRLSAYQAPIKRLSTVSPPPAPPPSVHRLDLSRFRRHQLLLRRRRVRRRRLDEGSSPS